jgi:hypothetical protein
MVLRTKTFEEKRRARRYVRWSGISASVLFVILLFIGFPGKEQWSFALDKPITIPAEALWTPVQAFAFLRCWLFALMLLSAGVFLSSAGILVEDWEVRGAHDAGVRRIINPTCGTCYMVGGVIFIAATVLVIRYIYLTVLT